ncbi:MAG: chromosome segregation protein SMC [Erysipelotrichaceae bacterium]|nr:chromosome segregation protein SMC [Erysipelotrichaceae bacterium]
MFLKRIEMQGFKSFADRTTITFDHPITGIVGPNGCGKSNIADAVRWVLGEQSAKSMRGEKMNDVIFAGSADRRKVNMAEVTLVFDNSNHILNSDQDELEVTRRLYRDSGDAEYLINRRNVRLKDVVDLFLDTGLGRDSLSIISQGNVVSFAEAKPADRRGIFEEAAGVAKYKKRKIESLSRLERTKTNLERSQDILTELEKQVSPLKRQAHKAEIYKEKKKRLEEIEITVLVNDIDDISKQIESADKTLFDIETNTTMYNTNIQVAETRIQEGRRKISALDQKINDLQEELMQNYHDVQALEARKTELDEKRKYIVETGSDKQKAEQMKDMLSAAKSEYEDRKQRYEDLQKDIRLFSEKLNQAAQNLADRAAERNQAEMKVRALENRRNVLESLLKNPFNNQQGIKAVMNNQHALHGILGVIGQVLHVSEGYEEAVSTALGGAMNYIVTDNEQSARDAIRFLTRNLSGRATFLPLTVCKPRYIRQQDQIICENTEGYLGSAADFVTCDETFNPVVESLLNNVLVARTMEAGNQLSSLTNRGYKIVTLNGEVIHRGGSMTGGKTKHNTNLVTMKKEAEDTAAQLDSENARLQLAIKNQNQASEERQNIAHDLQEKRYASASLEPVVDAKKAKYEKLRNDYALLQKDDDQDNAEAHTDDLVIRLNKAYARRDQITNEIKSGRDERSNENHDIERREAQLRQMRKDLKTAEASANAIKIDKTRLETKRETDLQRLASEYQLTYEFARTRTTDEDIENAKEEVAQLRADIEHLGNVNMEAPEQYCEVNERYETMKKNIEELTLSRDKILAAIDEMDTVMKKQFKEMFDKINTEFDNIFRTLYGGGKARLILQDPSDLLNTGIDIDAQPPGKAVQNNMLFSGGEKSLIALCVLFAILKVKPVPLVILDEVEAALDPGNVERFAQFLHNYTDRTQFIVVTHRVGTMEKADVLYGVTMQKQGVSQMLKVELKDAVKMAEPDGEVQS